MYKKYTEDEFEYRTALVYAWGRQDAVGLSNSDFAKEFGEAWQKYCMEFRTELRFFKTNLKSAFDYFIAHGTIDELNGREI